MIKNYTKYCNENRLKYMDRAQPKKENINISDRNKGGWFDKNNYMSWAMDCLNLKSIIMMWN